MWWVWSVTPSLVCKYNNDDDDRREITISLILRPRPPTKNAQPNFFSTLEDYTQCNQRFATVGRLSILCWWAWPENKTDGDFPLIIIIIIIFAYRGWCNRPHPPHMNITSY